MDRLNLKPRDTASPPQKHREVCFVPKVGRQALQQLSTDTFSFHAHCSCVILGWIFGKSIGSRRARKTRHLPLDKSNIYTAFETGVLSVPLPPGRESPCKTSSSSQQCPVLAKHSLKPELLRRPANSQEEARGAPGTAGVTQQEGEVAAGSCRRPQWLLWVGHGPRPAMSLSVRRTPPGL